MRPSRVAVAGLLVGAIVTGEPASAAHPGIGFTRMGAGPLLTSEGVVLAGDEVLVGSTRGRTGVVEVFGLDGAKRRELTAEGHVARDDLGRQQLRGRRCSRLTAARVADLVPPVSIYTGIEGLMRP